MVNNTSSSPFLSILFPAHNEQDRLLDALMAANEYLKKKNFSSEIIIVENASTDDTLAIANTFAASHDHVRVFHQDERGKGRAVRYGMLEAKGKYRFVCDVDLSMPIEEIDHFLPSQQSAYDIAIASREARGAVRYGEPLYRHLVGRVFNNLVRLLTLPDLNDTQCGFKCFTAEAAELLFPKMTITGWTFDVEILAIAKQAGLKVIEIPIQWYYHEHSKIHVLRDSMRMAADLLIIRRNIRRGTYASKN